MSTKKVSEGKGDGGVPPSGSVSSGLPAVGPASQGPSPADPSREEEEEFDEDEEHGELLGYYCLACGHSQTHRGWDECDRCSGPLDEWYA